MSPQRVPAGVIAWLAFRLHLRDAAPPAALGRDRAKAGRLHAAGNPRARWHAAAY